MVTGPNFFTKFRNAGDVDSFGQTDRTRLSSMRSGTSKTLVERVIPHFEAFPLLSSKRLDVELFAKICSMIHKGEHKTAEGFETIVEAAMKMNSSGKRKYTGSEILSSLTAR